MCQTGRKGDTVVRQVGKGYSCQTGRKGGYSCQTGRKGICQTGRKGDTVGRQVGRETQLADR